MTLTLDLWSEAFQAELERHRGADGVLRVREAGGRQLTGDEAWQQLTIRHASSSWNRLRTALLRRPEFRDGFEFYRALEVTQRGVAHLHVLIRRPGTSPWLIHYGAFRGLLDAAGFGRVTDVQRVSGGDRAAQYVTKATAAYTAKGVMQDLPRWTRRGTWSRGWNAAGWVRPTRIAGFRWQLGAAGAPFTAEALRASGFELVDPASCRVPASSAGSGGGGGGGTATRV